MAVAQSSVELTCKSCIRGYHIYMSVWTPNVDEMLHCKAQHNNTTDQYAVAVCTSDGKIVGHVPRKISRVCWLFLRKPEHELLCQILSGNYRRSMDLPQGGLEVECKLKFISKDSGTIARVHSVLIELSKDDLICNDISFPEE